MTYKSARWANDERVGVLLLPENGPSLFVDGGPLYERAVSGGFGPVGEPVVEPGPPPPPVTAADVKAEARRRILAFAPEWKQLNAIREVDSELFAKLDAIRAASDVIEAMDPIPDDYRDDKHWSAS